MKKRLLNCIASSSLIAGLVFSSAVIANTGTPDKPVANMAELLKQLENQRYQDSKENKQREAQFRSSKSKQATMLKQVQNEKAQQDALSAKLEKAFDLNDKAIADAQKRLKADMGSLSELFGHLTSAAGDALAQQSVSLSTVHYPERGAFFQELIDVSASGSELPNIEQIEKLFLEMQRELIDQGEVVSFTANVSDTQGVVTEQSVVRVGNFNIVDGEGNYLSLKPTGLVTLARQPSAHTAHAKTLVNSTEPFSAFGVDPTGPSGGSLLAALINTPSLLERWHQGGIVGMVISALGLVAVLLGAMRLVVLAGVSAKVNAQLKNLSQASENNPLGRVLVQANKYKAADLETLELKMNESIIRELPALQRFESFLKISAAVAPLLGLLGTVVGMILTFQAITIYGAGDPQAMAGGISSALVTTVLGLVVAIPTLLMHSFVSSKSQRIIHVLEEQAAGLVASSVEQKAA